MVFLSGDITGYTDQVLLQYGLSKRVAVSVNHFFSVANVIKPSNLICVLPVTAVAKNIIAGEIAATMALIEIMPHVALRKGGSIKGTFEMLFSIILMCKEPSFTLCYVNVTAQQYYTHR